MDYVSQHGIFKVALSNVIRELFTNIGPASFADVGLKTTLAQCVHVIWEYL